MKDKSGVVLGLNDSNSAAAIIRNGKLLAMAREERFDRIKFSDSYPANAVNYCLNEAGLSLKDIDRTVFAWNPGHELEPQDSSAAIRYHKHFLHYIPNNLLRHIGGEKGNKRISSMSERINFLKGAVDIDFLPHHRCHAASAFFVSPYNKAVILTIDAHGDDITSESFIGEDNKIKSISQTMYPYSLGHAYATLTQYLGYRANSDEWKIMGLASYGELEYYDLFSKIIRFDRENESFWIDLDYFTFYLWNPRRYSDKFLKALGPERYSENELNQKHMNIAASFQRRIEDVILEMCNYLYEKTKIDTLCLAGGVSMNSKMNGRILLESPFDKVWVQPSADDAGSSIGACFYYWNHILGNERDFVMEHDYWGAGSTNDEIKKTLDDCLVSYEYLEDVEKVAAKAIYDNKIIGWFQGKMESGQRSLGNRSILADPRDPDMKNKINKLIKHREWYRPFAPSIIDKCQGDFFESNFPSPFMQMVYPIKKNVQALIPAVTHADGTGRLQTVQENSNQRFWTLIDEFRKLSGIGLVLNTSFNDNDEPIVSTPKHAIRTFFGTGLHELYIGNYRVWK